MFPIFSTAFSFLLVLHYVLADGIFGIYFGNVNSCDYTLSALLNEG